MPPIQPIIFSYQQADVATLSFRQLDELNGLDKGSSFKVFKAYQAQLQEGTDYFYLSAFSHGDWIETLKAAGLIYASSVHLVLVTQRGYTRLQAF